MYYIFEATEAYYNFYKTISQRMLKDIFFSSVVFAGESF